MIEAFAKAQGGLFTKVEKEYSEAYMRRIAFLNKYW